MTPINIKTADLNGDGKIDIVDGNNSSGTVQINFGNGDGTFQNGVSFVSGTSPDTVSIVDLNGDGKKDLIVGSSGDNKAWVYLGNGNGTFQAGKSYSAGGGPTCAMTGDINNDGKQDFITTDFTDQTVTYLLGNGDGTLQGPVSIALPGAQPFGLALLDLHGNGNLDIVATSRVQNAVYVFQGNGTFQNSVSYSAGANPTSVQGADLNGDGKIDFVTASQSDGKVNVFINNGNGTFQADVSYAADTGATAVTLADINGDGYVDILSANETANDVSIHLNNGNGTFAFGGTYRTDTNPRDIVTSDFNNDGAIDFAVAAQGNAIDFRLGNLAATTTVMTTLSSISLLTQNGSISAINVLASASSQLASSRGIIGAHLARLTKELDVTKAVTDTFRVAYSRITDSDIAAQSATLISAEILQNAAGAVLAQANQQPALVLRLLKI